MLTIFTVSSALLDDDCGMWMARSALWLGMRAFRYAVPTSPTTTCPLSVAAMCAMVELKCYLRYTIAHVAGSEMRHMVVRDVGAAHLNARMPNDSAERTIHMSIDPHTAAIIIQEDSSFFRCFVWYAFNFMMLLTIQYEAVSCGVLPCDVACDNHLSNLLKDVII